MDGWMDGGAVAGAGGGTAARRRGAGPGGRGGGPGGCDPLSQPPPPPRSAPAHKVPEPEREQQRRVPAAAVRSARPAMPNFAGTWKMRSSENFDELLKALGEALGGGGQPAAGGPGLRPAGEGGRGGGLQPEPRSGARLPPGPGTRESSVRRPRAGEPPAGAGESREPCPGRGDRRHGTVRASPADAGGSAGAGGGSGPPLAPAAPAALRHGDPRKTPRLPPARSRPESRSSRPRRALP